MDQDYCTECDAPQEVIDVHVETVVKTLHGTGDDYRVYDLACGHSVVVPC